MDRKFKKIVLVFVLIGFVFAQKPVSADFSSQPQFEVDPFGNVTAVWTNYGISGCYFIQSSTQTSGSTWGEPTLLSDYGRYVTRPVLKIDGSGNTFTVWSDSDPDNSNNVIWGAIRPYGGDWSEPVQISSTLFSAEADYVLKLNRAGNVVLIWSAYDSGFSELHIYSSSATVANGWSSVIEVSTH